MSLKTLMASTDLGQVLDMGSQPKVWGASENREQLVESAQGRVVLLGFSVDIICLDLDERKNDGITRTAGLLIRSSSAASLWPASWLA